MFRCLLFTLLASRLLAQSTTVLENASVRVLEAFDRPHQKTALHKHDVNRVMIYVTAGDLDVTTEDGRTEHQHWKAGDVAWSPGGPLHVSENVGAADLRINVLRTRSVRTESFRTAFGSDFEAFARRFTREEHFVDAGEVADAAVALCSGLMDGVRGQVITVDRGTSFFDNLMRLYNERESLQL